MSYDHGAFIETGAQHVFVADLRFLARLAALATMMDLASFYSRLAQGTCLEEACRPQPFAQADLVVVFFAHLTL